MIAYNPLPDPQAWSLATRDGATFKVEGRVGLMRLEYRPWSGEVIIDHEGGPDVAQRMTITGLKQAPRVVVNGKRIDVAGGASEFKVALS